MYMNKKYNIEVSWRHLAEAIDKGHTEKHDVDVIIKKTIEMTPCIE